MTPAPIRGLQGGLAGQAGRVPGVAELGQRPRRSCHLVDVDVVGQHTEPGPTGGGQGLRERRVRRGRRQRLAVRCDGVRRVGEDAGVHARPVERHRPEHRIAQRGEQPERLVEGVLQLIDLPHPRRSNPELTEWQQREQVGRVFGQHLHRGVPVLLHRAAVAAAAGDRGLQRRSPQCVPPVQRCVVRGRDGSGRGLQLSVLHVRPAQQQPVSVGDEDRIGQVGLIRRG